MHSVGVSRFCLLGRVDGIGDVEMGIGMLGLA